MRNLSFIIIVIFSLTTFGSGVGSDPLAPNEEDSSFQSLTPIFRDQAAPKTIKEAELGEGLRASRLLNWHAELPMAVAPVPPKVGYQEFFMSGASRLMLNQGVEELNAQILADSFKPWPIGSDFSLVGSICKRLGDYDFVLMALIQLAYMNEKSQLLSAAAEHKLKFELLSHKGKKIYETFIPNNCFGIKITDSENHILMGATAQFLTNQLLAKSDPRPEFDNSRNGLTPWLLEKLQSYLKSDFSEFNSRPYQAYSWIAISNLYEHSADPRVKLMAQMVLDYMSVKFAIQTSDLRRHGPYRRQLRHYNQPLFTSGDRSADLFTFYFGHRSTLTTAAKLEPFQSAFGPFFAAIHSYRPPQIAYEIIFNQSEPIFQKFMGSDPEIYFRTADYLISAGGRYRNLLDAGDGMNDSLAQNSILIFHNQSQLLSSSFRFEGTNSFKSRNNTCLESNFLCGFNFSPPSAFPARCIANRGSGWIFYDLKACGIGNYYIATRILSSVNTSIKNLGLLEISKATLPFVSYQNSVLNRNKKMVLTLKGISSYHTSENKLISFNLSNSTQTSVILATDGITTKAKFSEWPLAEGQVMNSSGDGMIRSSFQNRQLTLDARDFMSPVRFQN